MASAKFLEEALSTDVDESAVSAVVGSLETQLVTSTATSATASGSITTVNQNHISSAISNGNGGPVSSASQKHGVSLAAGSVTMVNDASKTNTTTMATVQTVQTPALGQVNTAVASVASSVAIRPSLVSQVTSGISLTPSSLSNLTKGQDAVRVVYSPSPSSQASGGVNISNAPRLPLNPSTVGALQNGNVGLASQTHSVVNAASGVVTQNQLTANTNVNKQISQNISVISVLEQAKAAGTQLVFKTASGAQLGTQAVSIPSGAAVMPVPMSVNTSLPMTVTTISSAVTGSSATTSNASPVTLSKPMVQTVCATASMGLPGGIIQAPLQIINAVRPNTPGAAGQKRVVIGSQIVTRPGTPTQLTPQALQQIASAGDGQQVLIKLGNGQFQLVRIAAPQTTVSNITPSSTTSSAGQAFRVQSFPAPIGSIAVAPAATAASTTVPTTQVPVPALAATAAGTAAATGAQRPVDTTKEKCRKFLANLLELSSREPKSVEKNVRLLIQELVDSKVEPEEFCERLERLLNASPQPCLIGFLKKSLPLLRTALVSKELVIDGIRPPPSNVVCYVASSSTTTANAIMPPLQATQIRPPALMTQTVRVMGATPINATGAAVAGGMPTPRHFLQHRLVTVPITTSASIVVSAAGTVVSSSTTAATSALPASTASGVVTASSPAPVLVRSAPAGPLPIQTRTLLPIRQPTTIRQTSPVVMMRGPSPVIRATAARGKQTISLANASTLPVPALTSTDSTHSSTTVVSSVQTVTTVPSALSSTSTGTVTSITTAAPTGVQSNATTVISAAPQTSTSTTSSTTPFKPLSKEKEKKSFSSAGYTGDDDINDVAAMGGVNLAEETQRILGSTEFVGTQIRSCKDDIFLHGMPLHQKIKQIVAKHGLDEPNTDVAALISHATQERLKNLVEKLAVIAEHRLDIIKLDPRYEVTQDVKGQLKFLEELDRMERKRHDEKERELLLRAAKSRSRSEDPEQAKLKAKAKEMQRAEMEEVRQREANMTALQAIGPRKKPRLEGPASASLNSQANGSGTLTSNGATQGRGQLPSRPRLKRVNIRDLLFLLEQEKETCRSPFLYKAYLK